MDISGRRTATPMPGTDRSNTTGPMPGTTVGDGYWIEREVGRGGMATVWLAEDRKHARHVAVKVLLPELGASIGAERFLREIQLIARLQHPHILPLYDSGDAGGLLYFVMPYVEGESLRDRLTREHTLPLAECARTVRQIADALDYAHAKGVVHRDLKPENVMLTAGQALLADFGIARVVGDGPGTGAGTLLTASGVTLGTPAYMSPEQASGDPTVDARSDIYSLGCVVYEMLAGGPPFRGANAMAVISQHLVAPVPPLVGAREGLPSRVQDAVARALAKDPGERFAAAGDLASALEQGAVETRAPSAADQHLRDVERRHAARETVIVLEFANIAGAADADWLSTGIAETVGSDLKKVTGIRVIGQDSEMRRRLQAARQGRALDDDVALELGRTAGARWVAWGSFQKFGPRIRITPRYADTRTGTVMPGEKIDGVMDDIFELQDRIVTELAQVLRVELTSGEVAHIRQPETAHLSAYEHYATGYRAFLRFGKESVATAAEHFRAAIAIDPRYAMAQAGLGIIHGPMYIATGRRAVLDEGATLLESALALDPSLGEAYAWLSYMRSRQERFEDAERVARLGIEREPSSYWCWYMLGVALAMRATSRREPELLARAVLALLRVLAINPEYHAAYSVLGHLYQLRGEYGRAAMLADRGLTIEMAGTGLQFVGSYTLRAGLHLGVGELEETRPLLERAITRYAAADHVYADLMHALTRWTLGCLEERLGHPQRALDEFTRAVEIADANPHRIGIGAVWVKGQLGVARIRHAVGDADGAARAREAAATMMKKRSRFVWTYVMSCTDAELLYEDAATLAAFGRHDESLARLSAAADGGWADAVWLRHDPSFRRLRDDPLVLRLCVEAAGRVVLPPPVGVGGLE